MKSMIQRAISFVANKFENYPTLANRSACDDVVLGYSCISGGSHQVLLPGKWDRRRAGNLYSEIAGGKRSSNKVNGSAGKPFLDAMRIVRECVTNARGKISCFIGDAILAEFDDAELALKCAVNLQLVVRRWNGRHQPARQMQIRVGISYGEIIPGKGEIYVKVTNLFDLFEGLEHFSGIWISESVRAKLES